MATPLANSRDSKNRLAVRCLVLAFLSALTLVTPNWLTEKLPAQDASNVEEDNADSEKAGPREIQEQEGPIQKLAAPFNDLFDIAWDNGRLSFSMKGNYEEINSVMEAIREVVGWGGNSSYGGTDEFNFDITTDKINGHIRREKQADSVRTSLFVEEIVEPGRSMRITLDGDDKLQITINVSQSAYILRITQFPGGQFMVQELSGTEVFAQESKDFGSFCREHRVYTTDRLLPVLKHFSLGQILTPYSPVVQQRVTELMAPWKAEDLAKVQELTDPLGSKTWSDRNAASAELEKNYKGNEAILARLVHDPGFHPEIRARTRKLIRENVDAEQLAELDFVDQVAASLDAAYLVDLIQMQPRQDVRNILMTRLREMAPEARSSDLSDDELIATVTNQTLRTWASNLADPIGNQAATSPLDEAGPLQEIAEQTGQLVRLAWHDDSLTIDREHWKTPFGGRSIEDISSEVRELAKKHNLPDNWFREGGPMFAAKSAGHPQVLFEKLQEKCESNAQQQRVRHYSHYSGYEGNTTPNRQFDKETVQGALIFDRKARNNRSRPATDNPVNTSDSFLLNLSEKSGPKRSLVIDESAPGQLRLMITGDASNYIVQLLLENDRALIQDVRGSRVIAMQAANFRQLQTEYPDYFDQTFFPLLRHLGIIVDTIADDGRDTTLKSRQRRIETQPDSLVSTGS